jgi:hypothetical protein
MLSERVNISLPAYIRWALPTWRSTKNGSWPSQAQ